MNPSVAKKFLETKEDSVAENATVTENLFIKASAHPFPTPETTNSKKSESRFFGVYELDPERYSRDLTRLSQEILQHISSIDGVKLNINIEIHAEVDEGFSAEKVRVILENARLLRFKQASFEGE